MYFLQTRICNVTKPPIFRHSYWSPAPRGPRFALPVSQEDKWWLLIWFPALHNLSTSPQASISTAGKTRKREKRKYILALTFLGGWYSITLFTQLNYKSIGIMNGYKKLLQPWVGLTIYGYVVAPARHPRHCTVSWVASNWCLLKTWKMSWAMRALLM